MKDIAEPQTTENQSSAWLSGLIKRVVLAVCVTLILLLFSGLFERTATAHRLKTLTFEFLTGLASFGAHRDLPIVVVDTGKIPGGKDGPTPRSVLRESIQAIADNHPKAIAVDIDFSPGPDGWKVDHDPEFFDFCLSLKQETGVPIFLGVYDARGEQAAGWLGLAKYKELAAVGVVDTDDKMRLVRWIQGKDVQEKLPTLSAALATAYRPSLPSPHKFLSRTIEVTRDNTHGVERYGEDHMRFGVALVNYTKLNEIVERRLATISAQSISEHSDRFRGKMVLLGDATNSEDRFIVPGQPDPVAGVYVLACAAYTLGEEPLFEFNSTTRLTLDLSIAVTIVLLIQTMRFLYVNKRPGVRFYRAQAWAIGAVISVVFIFGVVLISVFHIMWFDFPLVIFTSLLHPRIEHALAKFGKKLTPFRPSQDRRTS